MAGGCLDRLHDLRKRVRLMRRCECAVYGACKGAR